MKSGVARVLVAIPPGKRCEAYTVIATVVDTFGYDVTADGPKIAEEIAEKVAEVAAEQPWHAEALARMRGEANHALSSHDNHMVITPPHHHLIIT